MKRLFSVSVVVCLLAAMALVAGAAEPPVRIGLSAPITGNYAEYGQNFQVSVQMAADEINAKGGLRGRKVEIAVMDSKGDPKESALIAQKFVEDRTIVATIGDFTSSCCLSAAPIYERAGLVQLSPTASSPDFAPSGDYMFGIVGTQDAEGPFNAKNIAKDYLKVTKVASIYINNDWGVVTNDRFVKALRPNGLELVAAEPFMEAEKDFTAVLTKIRRANPEALFVAAMYNEAAAIARQVQKMGWNVALFAPSSVFSSQLLELGGDAVEGLATNAFFVLSDPDPVVQKYIKDFEARAKRFPNLHAACAYDSMMILAAAIEKAGFDRKAIRDALAATKGYMGVTGEITFTPVGDVVRNYKIIAVEKGEWVVKKGF
ncbi:MAG: Leucine-, isoleucine-, valine-, threonine-, and alanine-binding protein precursor [Firmicutes bacterium ADurb.Bin506]|nr:MAG: Leucine-, isoleucine-, valine-, threonine-, and alanine-binding protein precursor [Firmicutes bacterium ADurb.Bin506]